MLLGVCFLAGCSKSQKGWYLIEQERNPETLSTDFIWREFKLGILPQTFQQACPMSFICRFPWNTAYPELSQCQRYSVNRQIQRPRQKAWPAWGAVLNRKIKTHTQKEAFLFKLSRKETWPVGKWLEKKNYRDKVLVTKTSQINGMLKSSGIAWNRLALLITLYSYTGLLIPIHGLCVAGKKKKTLHLCPCFCLCFLHPDIIQPYLFHITSFVAVFDLK